MQIYEYFNEQHERTRDVLYNSTRAACSAGRNETQRRRPPEAALSRGEEELSAGRPWRVTHTHDANAACPLFSDFNKFINNSFWYKKTHSMNISWKILTIFVHLSTGSALLPTRHAGSRSQYLLRRGTTLNCTLSSTGAAPACRLRRGSSTSCSACQTRNCAAPSGTAAKRAIPSSSVLMVQAESVTKTWPRMEPCKWQPAAWRRAFAR